MTGGDGPSRQEWFAVIGIVVLALVLRIVVAVQFESGHPLADRPVIDEAAYESWALEIAGGDLMGDEVFFQEPLYPYWMASVFAVFGDSRTALRHAQAGVGALTVVLLWALTRRLFGRTAGLVAAFALATYRPLVLLPSLLLKPNLFVPLVAGLALLVVLASGSDGATARRRWLAVGLVAGLGALLRGNMLILLPLFALWPFQPAGSQVPHDLGNFLPHINFSGPITRRLLTI